MNLRFIITTTLIAIAVYPTALSAKRIYYDRPTLDTSRVYTAPIDSAPSYFAIEARCAMPLNKVSRHTVNKWRIVWDYLDNDNYRYAQFSIDYRQYADGIDMPKAIVSLGRVVDNQDESQLCTEVATGINFDIGYNSMSVEWRNGVITTFVGSGRMKYAGTIQCQSPQSRMCGIVASDSIIVAQMITESEIPASRPLLTHWTRQALLSHLAQSVDPNEGIWAHLDRENNPSKARMGGTYTLATVWDPQDSVYDLIYISGAEVNSKEWEIGMIKGHLQPTIFQDRYSLVWYDALCKPIERDCNASISQSAILELRFPLMETVIRLSRAPKSDIK